MLYIQFCVLLLPLNCPSQGFFCHCTEYVPPIIITAWSSVQRAEQSLVNFLLLDPFFTVILLKDAPGMFFLYRIFSCFQLFGGISYHKQNCWMKQCFFLIFVMDFHIIPQKDCVHLKVSPVNRAFWPLAPALMDGYHLNTGRQKTSWLYLYFLSCYGDGILFFSVFINQISFWWIISSFPWHLCSTYFCYGLYEGLASVKMLAIFFF